MALWQIYQLIKMIEFDCLCALQILRIVLTNSTNRRDSRFYSLAFFRMGRSLSNFNNHNIFSSDPIWARIGICRVIILIADIAFIIFTVCIIVNDFCTATASTGNEITTSLFSMYITLTLKTT